MTLLNRAQVNSYIDSKISKGKSLRFEKGLIEGCNRPVNVRVICDEDDTYQDYKWTILQRI